ncbi:unnamed protein product, partial [Mesorhabditis belari]|uniref:PKD/REJ-like domain-containing protein n=1 Tax=Mesorhabditis belari TaxID=2138241 RepID=A0AAF3FKT2_9BILA
MNNFNCTLDVSTIPPLGEYTLECEVAVNGEPITLIPPQHIIVQGMNFETTTRINFDLSPTIKQDQTTGTSPTVFNGALAQIQFNNDLLGLTITANTGDYFPIGLISCSNVFADPSRLGVNATCMGIGNSLLVTFGIGATLLPGQSLTLRTSFFTSQLFATMPTLTVIGPTTPISPSFIVDAPRTVSTCLPVFSINLRQLSGHGKRSLSFQWSFPSDNPFIQSNSTMRNISIPTMELNGDNLKIGVTVCNYINQCTSVNNITIFVDKNAIGVFDVAILGGGKVYPSMRILLEAVPSFTFCGSATPISPLDTHYIWYKNGIAMSQAGSLKISPFEFSVNDTIEYRVQGIYSTNETTYVDNATLILNFIAQPLLVVLSSYQLTVPSDQQIVIDASGSKDPNTMNGLLSHSWSCLNLTSNSSCQIEISIEWNSSILLVPSGYLNDNMSFSFTDTMSGSGLSADVSSIVAMIESKTPSIRFVPFTQGKLNVHDYARIQSFVKSSYGSLNTTWEVMKNEKYGWFDLETILPQNWKTFDEEATLLAAEVLLSLTIPPAINDWPGLLPGTTYAVVLVATNSAGTATSLFEFQTNSPPIPGNLDMNPVSSITALSDLVTLSMGDGWIDPDTPMMFRFGIRVLNFDNTTTVNWNRQSMNSAYTVYLATAGFPPNMGCQKRIGYTAMIEVCDCFSACTIVESSNFSVKPSTNLSLASSNVLNAILSDMDNEMTFSALEKLEALTEEECNVSLNPEISNKVAMELLKSLDDTSSNDEYREVLSAVTQMLGSVDESVLQLMSSTMMRYQIRLMSASATKRKKRDTLLGSLTEKPVTNNNDEGIFVLCDRLLKNGATTILFYFQAIENALSDDCKQLDDTSERIIAEKGEGYTFVQAQSLSTSDPTLVNRTYTLAGATNNKIISFDEIFRLNFESWNCGDGSTLCDYTCLASASISSTLFGINVNFSAYFFNNQYSALTANKSASNLYRISIKDPLSGNDVLFAGMYRILVPLTAYKSANYYNCFIFSLTSNIWDSRGCISALFPTTINGSNFLSCNCTQTGIIGVFTVSAPTPPTISIHNQIEIDFSLTPNSTIIVQQAQLLNRLATASGLDRSRLVQSNSNAGFFSFILLPPINTDQLSNSYAVQAISRAVDPRSGVKLFDTGVKLVDTSWAPVIRNLSYDSYARKVIAKIERSYAQVIGNNTNLAALWATTIAQAMQISQYRIKNPQIYPGIVFNFTITVPFDQEIDPLSAEEISVMLIEATSYGELTLPSSTGDFLPVDALTEADIVILMVLESSNALAIGIVSGVSLTVGLATIYILGAVYVKLRTDKLIQLERERILMSNPVPPPPQYPIAVTEPLHVQGNGTQRRRTRSVITNLINR